MQRLPIQDPVKGVALHTCGWPLHSKVYRDDSGNVRLSLWIGHDVSNAAGLLHELEAKRLPAAHPLHAALAGIQCLTALETWLRSPHSEVKFPVLPGPAASAGPSAYQPLPLRTTEDLAQAAAMIALGFLPEAGAELVNAGDGTHAALPLRSVSRTDASLFARDLPALQAASCKHHFAYALYAARNWIAFRIKRDPAKAREFSALLRGVGERGAVVSRRLLETTAPYIEVPLPDGTTRRVKNRFRDQMRNHLRGFAASEA